MFQSGSNRKKKETGVRHANPTKSTHWFNKNRNNIFSNEVQSVVSREFDVPRH
jgi:hypothetical protein